MTGMEPVEVAWLAWHLGGAWRVSLAQDTRSGAWRERFRMDAATRPVCPRTPRTRVDGGASGSPSPMLHLCSFFHSTCSAVSLIGPSRGAAVLAKALQDASAWDGWDAT
ncbi:uncharacterized protein LOC117649526 isoform X1 [Thrips palmi]|uniref:Uncharacterized protein LOC117649526 isoform X1 n=1 Tax=Thrips palmi TaxID=161013 RepID=A0A6P8ZSQ5_THRPL|nr:uncharacterized protein LOC117649526 isoform X1 [Thrips palmi]